MRPIGEAGYILTLRELVFLASLCGLDKLYGIEYDSGKLNKEQIKAQWEQISVLLESKKYIDIELDGSITIDKELHAIICACGRPTAIIRIAGNDKDMKRISRIFYLTENISVQLDEDRMIRDKLILTPIASFEQVAMNFSECFVFEGDFKNYNVNINLKVHEIDTINQCVESMDKHKAIVWLKDLGFDELIAHNFFRALTEKKFISSMVWLINRKYSYKYTAIVGEEILWVLETNKQEKDTIIIKSCSAIDVEKGAYDAIITLKDKLRNIIVGKGDC